MSKTLGELSQEFSYVNVQKGTIGTPLKYKDYTKDEIQDLVSEHKYQRLISASALKKQGIMNWSVLLPMVIAVRPDSVPQLERGSRVIDGQHKGIKYLQSGTEKPYTCCVIEHEEGSTLTECEKEEAKIFTILNTKRKKLTKLDEIRAGVVWEQDEAHYVQEVLLSLRLKVDGLFGSDADDAKELKGFYQFWFLTCDYNRANLDKITKGYDLWKKMFKNKKDKNSKRVSIGQFGKIINLLKENKCKKVLFAGKVKKPKFSKLRLDFKGVYYMPRIIKSARIGDAAILKEIIQILKREKITTISSLFFNTELALKKGIYTKIKPNKVDNADINKAISILNKLNKYNFSQGAVVRNKKLVAIEGRGGTKNLLKRLKNKKLKDNGVLVKFPKKKTRFKS